MAEQQPEDSARESAQAGASGNSSLDEVVARLSSGYRSIGDMVYEVLRQALLSGAFAPGEHLRQEALATAIGVSRLPVRAALLRLDAEGLVEFHPRRGAVVKTLTQAQLTEIYELRNLLECYALRKSMSTMTPERVAGLRRNAEVLDSEEEGEAFLDVRVRFYRELYDADNSPHLVELIEELRSRVGRYLLGWRVSGTRSHHGSHVTLIEHIERGNLDKAEEWLRKHLREVSAGVARILSGDSDREPEREFPA
jgi:DNA-binding GntR family transcriptional regulator